MRVFWWVKWVRRSKCFSKQILWLYIMLLSKQEINSARSIRVKRGGEFLSGHRFLITTKIQLAKCIHIGRSGQNAFIVAIKFIFRKWILARLLQPSMKITIYFIAIASIKRHFTAIKSRVMHLDSPFNSIGLSLCLF